MRYAFALYEVWKSDNRDVHYEELALLEVDAKRFSLDELKLHLRPWAVSKLRQGDYEIGMFNAVFATLDEHDQPDECVHEEDIPWSGRGEIGAGQAASAFLVTLWAGANVSLAVEKHSV